MLGGVSILNISDCPNIQFPLPRNNQVKELTISPDQIGMVNSFVNPVDLIISVNPKHVTTNEDSTTALTHPLIKQMKVIDSEQFYQKKMRRNNQGGGGEAEENSYSALFPCPFIQFLEISSSFVSFNSHFFPQLQELRISHCHLLPDLIITKNLPRLVLVRCMLKSPLIIDTRIPLVEIRKSSTTSFLDSFPLIITRNGFIDYLNSTQPIYWKSSLMEEEKEEVE
jgi:hypothetical protein